MASKKKNINNSFLKILTNKSYFFLINILSFFIPKIFDIIKILFFR